MPLSPVFISPKLFIECVMNKAKSKSLSQPLTTLLFSACLAVIGPTVLGLNSSAFASNTVINLPDFSGLVEKSGPAVVNVRSIKKEPKSDDEEVSGGVANSAGRRRNRN